MSRNLRLLWHWSAVTVLTIGTALIIAGAVLLAVKGDWAAIPGGLLLAALLTVMVVYGLHRIRTIRHAAPVCDNQDGSGR